MFGLLLPAWFTKNPVFIWGAAILAGLAALRVSNEIAEARGRRQMRRRMEEKSRKVQAKLREKLDEKSVQANNTRVAVRDVPSAAELPERTRSRFIRPD